MVAQIDGVGDAADVEGPRLERGDAGAARVYDRDEQRLHEACGRCPRPDVVCAQAERGGPLAGESEERVDGALIHDRLARPAYALRLEHVHVIAQVRKDIHGELVALAKVLIPVSGIGDP